jgi:hypothetical protein
MSGNEELYDTYTRAASAASQEERLQLLRQCAHEEFELISPFPYHARGIDEVAAKLGEVAAAMPNGRLELRRTTEVDGHNHVFRTAYGNFADDGTVLSTGLHVAEVRDGRLARIFVFVPADLPAPL